MKLVITMHYAAMAANVGGNVEARSHIVDIPAELVPQEVSDYLKHPERYQYTGLSLSYLKEPDHD